MIVRSVVSLANGLGQSVVAEGVESEDTFEWLRALGCDQVQRYRCGSAMEGAQLLNWLSEWPSCRVAARRPATA